MDLCILLSAYVSRTYIGGGSSSQSSLAMKIHRKSSKSQLSLLPNSGSLSSLHETALTSDAEEVRSSVSAYHPVSSYTKRSSKRYFDTLNLTLKCCLWIVNECNIIYQKFEVGVPFCVDIFFGLFVGNLQTTFIFCRTRKNIENI